MYVLPTPANADCRHIIYTRKVSCLLWCAGENWFMRRLCREKCKVYLISAPDQPGRKRVYHYIYKRRLLSLYIYCACFPGFFFHFRAFERKLVCASKRRALANEVFQMIEHLHLHHTTFFLGKEKLEDENSLTGWSKLLMKKHNLVKTVIYLHTNEMSSYEAFVLSNSISEPSNTKAFEITSSVWFFKKSG